jgi:choline dehydrogenase-like flavoprotein
MLISNLRTFGSGTTFDADLVIIGGGAAGLTIARQFMGSSIRVLILESGELEESEKISKLNTVESIGEPRTLAQLQKRVENFSGICPSWSSDDQGFGMRCRVLGGSTRRWFGKSAPFDEIDFAERAWVPYSGWPFSLETIQPYIDRAADALNLGPNRYDESLWEHTGASAPEPRLNSEALQPFYWLFACSRNMGIMRLGSEFLKLDAPNIRVLLNATASAIHVNEAGSTIDHIDISTIDGVRARVHAKAAVLAASAIENARLLLVSRSFCSTGLGNQHDVVGRFLMDHCSTRLASFDADDIPSVINRFGFMSLEHRERIHLVMPGVVLKKAVQEQEQLLNCAAYMTELREADSPLNALKRLLRFECDRPYADLIELASSPGLIAKYLGARAFEHALVPEAIQRLVVRALLKKFPNYAVREFRSRSVTNRLVGIQIDGICEQCPDPESRITLSETRDALGLPLPRINWRIDDRARSSLMRLGQLLETELPRAGLPKPKLDGWIAQGRPDDGLIIDMAHTAGTTRISENPKTGVVDANCQVHGVAGLYIAGASVFPTGGHVNPTLMILSLAIRLADRIKRDLAPDKTSLASRVDAVG